VDPTQENPDLEMVITKIPELRLHDVLFRRDLNVSKILSLVAHLIHYDDRNAGISEDYDIDEFLRRAFFLDSDTPEPLNAVDEFPLPYRFKSLQEVVGDEFLGYDREYIRSRFVEFVLLIRLEWENAEPNPAPIPSIVELIEGVDDFILK
jgi:hypothetical protein